MVDSTLGMPLTLSLSRADKLNDPDYLIGLLWKYLEELQAIDRRNIQPNCSKLGRARRIDRRIQLRNRCFPFVLGWLNRHHPGVAVPADLVSALAEF